MTIEVTLFAAFKVTLFARKNIGVNRHPNYILRVYKKNALSSFNIYILKCPKIYRNKISK
jgi:hypothetical protein